MLTYSDAVEHLVTFLGGGADDRMQAQVRLAVYDAYRRVTQHPKGWRYYINRARVNLNGLYSEGTIAYVASTRTFTLTGNTFPSWAKFGEIRIGSRAYEVESNPTSTTLVIDSINAPTEDIDAGTSYELVQTSYALPSSFQDLYWVEGDDNWRQDYVTPEQWYALDRTSRSVGAPIYWTVLGNSNPKYYGGKSLVVYPAPTEDAPNEFLMRRRPRDIRYSGQSAPEQTGTVSVSLNGTAVTGSGTSFSTRMAGSVLRVTDGSYVPTALGGLEPYTDEFVISSVESATALTLVTPATTAYTTAKFRITDPLDIDDCMETAFRAACIYEVSKVRNETDADTARQRAAYLEELNRAWEIDTLRAIDRAGIPLFSSDSAGRFYTSNYIIER